MHTQGRVKMPVIVALNPSKKKKGKKKMEKQKKRKMTALQLKYFGPGRKKGADKMAKGKKPGPKKKRGNPQTITKYKTRPNSMAIGGVNFGGAVKSTVPLLFGALVAKFAAKKFAAGGAESDNWSWKNYMLALAGGFVAAFGTNAVLRKRAAAQKVFEGALLLIAYKVFTNEIAPQNQSLESWFGADADFDPYAGINYGVGEAGDIWQGGSEDYVKGVDGMWRPASEAHRMPRGGGPPFGYRRGIRKDMGDVLVDPDSRYGDILVDENARYSGAAPTAPEMARTIESDGM